MGLRALSGTKPDARLGHRLRLGVPATLALPQGTRKCLIDDISASGARLRVERPLAEQQSVELTFHELKLFATVVWHDRGECGLRFDRPIDPEDMRGMLWIKQNRALYDRICSEGGAEEWAAGVGGN